MRASLLRTSLLSLLIASSIVPRAMAQGGGDSGAPPMTPLTPFEDFVARLKLDAKTQLPEVQQILTAASQAVVAPAQEKEQLRQRLIAAELANRHADADPLLAAHRAAAAREFSVEVKAFSQIYALLKPNQQSKAPQAFEMVLGLLEPQVNVGGRGPRGGGRGGATSAGGARYAVAGVGGAVAFAPQRGGGGGGGGLGVGAYKPSRFEILETTLSLTKDQKKAAKSQLDEAYKAATPVRDALATTRAAVVTAIQGGRTGADLDPAISAHAEQISAMAGAEVAALAKVVLTLDETQRANTAGVMSVFSMMRNAFVGKKWDVIPAGR